MLGLFHLTEGSYIGDRWERPFMSPMLHSVTDCPKNVGLHDIPDLVHQMTHGGQHTVQVIKVDMPLVSMQGN